MAEEKPILYILFWLHLLLLLNYINLASVSNRREDTPLRLSLGCEWQRCSTNAMSNEELVLQQLTPPEHLCQGSWSGDTECAQPQPIALQTLHTTPRRSERRLKAAVADPGQVFLPSFVLPTAHTERLSPPPASSPGGITCYIQQTASPRCCR